MIYSQTWWPAKSATWSQYSCAPLYRRPIWWWKRPKQVGHKDSCSGRVSQVKYQVQSLITMRQWALQSGQWTTPSVLRQSFWASDKKRKERKEPQEEQQGREPCNRCRVYGTDNTEHKDSGTKILIHAHYNIYGRIWIQEDNWASKGVRKWSQIANIKYRPASKYWLNKLPN